MVKAGDCSSPAGWYDPFGASCAPIATPRPVPETAIHQLDRVPLIPGPPDQARSVWLGHFPDGAYRIGKDGKLISTRPMVCDDEKAALKRESKNSESSKFSDRSRIETFAWPRREVGREQAKGETPSSSISSNKKCLARNAEKDERNSLEPARETLRPGVRSPPLLWGSFVPPTALSQPDTWAI